LLYTPTDAGWGTHLSRIVVDDNGMPVSSVAGVGGVGDRDSEDERTMFLGNAVQIFQDFLVMRTASGFYITLRLGTVRVQIFDRERGTIFEGTLGDVITEQSMSGNGSRIFVRTNRSTAHSILIYQ